MKKQMKPVWVWLPGSKEPVVAGQFEIQDYGGNPTGLFSYDSAYGTHEDAFSLDPIHIALHQKRLDQQYKCRLNRGLFGVFRDVCPEGYGRDLLNYRFGKSDEPLSDMDLMEKSMGDSAGAIEVCEDIEIKIKQSISSSLDQLVAALSTLDAGRAASRAVHHIYEIGTSMGGERPKLTVSDHGELWLAKLQDRGDAPHMPARECVVMQLARECGINAAEVALIRTDNLHEVALIKRFDRVGDAGERLPYLSAHTALGLDVGTLPDDPARSYLVLADRARRMGVEEGDIREIWMRMAYNALINNTDDHPRNHGFIRVDGAWALAPAFDMVPLVGQQVEDGPVLALSVTKDRQRQATVSHLMSSADHFGWESHEAAEWLIQSATIVKNLWRTRMLEAGVNEEFCDHRQILSFRFATGIADQPERVEKAIGETKSRRRRPRGRGY